MTTVVVHQPEYLPYLGFFHRLFHADVLVLLDSVQYTRRTFQNRNRIRGGAGAVWLTVPVQSAGRYTQRIVDVEIDTARVWRSKHWRALEYAYGRTPWFDNHRPFLADLYKREWTRLVDLNEALIRYVLGCLDIPIKVVRASELGVTGKATDLLAAIVKRVGGDTYLSGPGAGGYLLPSRFAERGLRLRYQRFTHPVYDQGGMPFVSFLSTVDLLFHHGARSRAIVQTAGSVSDVPA